MPTSQRRLLTLRSGSDPSPSLAPEPWPASPVRSSLHWGAMAALVRPSCVNPAPSATPATPSATPATPAATHTAARSRVIVRTRPTAVDRVTTTARTQLRRRRTIRCHRDTRERSPRTQTARAPSARSGRLRQCHRETATIGLIDASRLRPDTRIATATAPRTREIDRSRDTSRDPSRSTAATTIKSPYPTSPSHRVLGLRAPVPLVDNRRLQLPQLTKRRQSRHDNPLRFPFQALRWPSHESLYKCRRTPPDPRQATERD